MAGSTPKRGTEKATIDCCMIVVTTEEETPRCIGITSGTKLSVEPQMETTEAVKLLIKGTLKAQKPEKQTLTGHTITFLTSCICNCRKCVNVLNCVRCFSVSGC